MYVILQYTLEIDQMNDSLNVPVALLQLYGKARVRSLDVNVHAVAI